MVIPEELVGRQLIDCTIRLTNDWDTAKLAEADCLSTNPKVDKPGDPWRR